MRAKEPFSPSNVDMPMRRLVVLLVLALGCGRRTNEGRIVPDPALSDAAPPKESPAPPPNEPRWMLLHGKSLDLSAHRVEHALEKDLPRRESSFGDTGYLVSKGGELRAYDLPTGKLRWSETSAACSVLVAAQGGAFCGKGTELVLHDAATGKARVLPSISTGNLTQVLSTGHRVLSLRDDRTLESYDASSGAVAGASSYPFMPYASRDGLAANARGACGASPPGVEVTVACVDANAKLTWSKTYPLRKPGESSLWMLTRQLDASWFVVSTWSVGPTRRGIVVRLSDGFEALRVEEEIVAAIGKANGDLEGVLATKPDMRFLEPSGAVRWTSKEKLDDGASALLLGETMAVASYHPIATGAELRGFDRATGKLLWRGDVEMLPIAHSKYFNHVELSLSFGKIAMRGKEAAQSYLQIFDPKDGARTFSEIRGLW